MLLSLFNLNIKNFLFGIDNYKLIQENGESIMQVYYPKGSSSPSQIPIGGIGFYTMPKNITNATDVTLNYFVKFHETFKPMIGGKLPGIYINNKNFKGGSGGKHTNNTSCRIAWRSNFTAEAYVYLPKHVKQNDDYYKNTLQNSIYGDSIWRGEFQFDSNRWNSVSVRIRLNTFDNQNPKTDGILQLTINNVTRTLNDLIWTTNTNNRINNIIFETFFGGKPPLASTPNDTWVYFKNVSVFEN